MPGPSGQVVVALGLGAGDEVTLRVFRKAAAALARAARRQQRVATTLLADLPTGDGDFGDGAPQGLARADVARALAEGTILGAYRYNALKSDPEASNVVRVDVVDGGEGDGDGLVTAAFERGVTVAEAVCLARDLVNEPGGELTPTAFADRAAELARGGGFTVEVLDRAAIEGEKMGGLLGVNRGSTEEPRFVKLAYEPAEAPGDRGPGRQGHHVRLGRPVAQDHRGHGRHEVRHGGGRRGARHLQRPRRAQTAGAGARVPAADRQHARRRRHPGGRRAAHPQRHDRRGPQHRRRGPAGAGRRPGHGQRGPARRHRRPGHPHRRLHGGPGHPHRRADGQRRRLRRPGAGRGRRRRRGRVAPAPARATCARASTPRWPT